MDEAGQDLHRNGGKLCLVDDAGPRFECLFFVDGVEILNLDVQLTGGLGLR